MSFWSTLGKVAGTALSIAGDAIPVVGDYAQEAGSAIAGFATDYENKKAAQHNLDVQLQENATNRQFNAQQSFLNRQFNSKEAEKARLFNAQHAALQNQWNLDAWSRENEYNSPINQMKRLRDAGYNPNLFGGQNTAGSIASVTPASSAPASSSAASYGSGVSPAPYSITNPAMEAAQTRLMNAQASDLESQTNRRDELLPGEIRKQGADFNFVNSEINLNTKRGKEIDARCQQIAKDMQYTDKLIEQSEAYKRLLTLQGDEKKKELEYFEERFIKEMRVLDDQHLIDEKELKVMASQISKNLADASAANSVAVLNGVQFKIQTEYGMKLAKVQFDTEKAKYDVVVDDADTSFSENVVKRRKAVKEQKKLSARSTDTWANRALNELEMVTDALNGSVNVGVGAHKTFK